MGLQASSVYVCLLYCVLLWSTPYHQAVQGQALPESGISDIAFDALLKDLRGNKFFTAATALSLLARPYLQPKTTLLIPTDNSLVEAVAFPPKDYLSLIKFHILEKNFNFKQLRLLPVGTWIPTALPSFAIEVTSNTAANFSLGTAQLTKPNLCPSLVSSFISCQGINAILNPNAQLSPNPFRFGATPPATAPPSLPPSSFPPIFLPPSFAPTTPPPLNTPSTLAPSPSSSSASLAPSPTPFPATTILPSPSTVVFPSPPSQPPSVLPSTPLPTVPSPSTPTENFPATPAPAPLALANPQDLPQAPGFSENGGDGSPSEASSLSVGATVLTTFSACVLMLTISF
ncbi:hypothetical protein L7F22_038462 [Adiantum nelumboides]|nr:hypothetical protein [Adiantum nelumboides]